MYVCVCNALKERDIRKAARESGSARPTVAYAAIGCRPQCGLCKDHARAVLREELENTAPATFPGILAAAE